MVGAGEGERERDEGAVDQCTFNILGVDYKRLDGAVTCCDDGVRVS